MIWLSLAGQANATAVSVGSAEVGTVADDRDDARPRLVVLAVRVTPADADVDNKSIVDVDDCPGVDV